MKKAKPKTKAKAAPREVLPVRKVIQVSVSQAEHWLLCDDGTVWYGAPGNWSPVNIEGVVFDAPPPPPAPPVAM